MADETKGGALRLILVTHSEKALETSCDEVALPGKLGDIGVLPGHTPLMTSLRPGVVSYRSDGQEEKLVISSGFCEIRSDIVTILTENAEAPGAADLDAARNELKEAEALMNSSSGAELEEAQARYLLADARLSAAGD